MTPDLRGIDAAMEATWPPAAISTELVGGFRLRDGAGGGQRVSAATAEAAPSESGIEQAEAAMASCGQPPLFRVRPGEEALDALLAARGYGRRDETVILDGPLAPIAEQALPLGTAFAVWTPLAVMEELWSKGGTGPARLAVMHRASGPRTGILARAGQSPAGVAFAAIHERRVMVHAVWVEPDLRRQKTAHRMMVCAAKWAQYLGAARMTVLCLRHNSAANLLYRSLGLETVGQYHYRAKKEHRTSP